MIMKLMMMIKGRRCTDIHIYDDQRRKMLCSKRRIGGERCCPLSSCKLTSIVTVNIIITINIIIIIIIVVVIFIIIIITIIMLIIMIIKTVFLWLETFLRLDNFGDHGCHYPQPRDAKKYDDIFQAALLPQGVVHRTWPYRDGHPHQSSHVPRYHHCHHCYKHKDGSKVFFISTNH